MKLTLSALPRDVIVRTLPALIRLLTTRTSQCSILAHITNVHDLMALRLTSRLMRDCLLAAPLRLALGSSRNGDVSVRLLGAAFPATVALTLPTQSVRPLCLTDDTLTALSPLSRLETLDLSFASQLSNDAVRSIARFERLTSLSLAGCLQVDDDTLMSLSGLSQLRFLSLLFLDRLTNASLLKLGETLTALEELHLGNCYRVSDAGLATLPPSLRVLNMQFVAAGDLGLGFVSRLTRLECLNLYGCRRVGSACMAALSGLNELRLLSLGDTSVNDEGLRHLASVPNLQRLNLYALPGLTDAGLSALRALSSLATLDIEYCNISEEAAVALARAMGVRHLNLHGCRGGDWAGAARAAAKWGHVTSRCEMYCSWHLKRYRQPRGSLSGMYIF